MMIETTGYYQAKIPYTVKNRKETGVVVVTGVNDLVLITTDCNGKTYEKLENVKQSRKMTPDEACHKAVETAARKLHEWISKKKEGVNGQDFYKHCIKTGQEINGFSLGNYFEMELEGGIGY